MVGLLSAYQHVTKKRNYVLAYVQRDVLEHSFHPIVRVCCLTQMQQYNQVPLSFANSRFEPEVALFALNELLILILSIFLICLSHSDVFMPNLQPHIAVARTPVSHPRPSPQVGITVHLLLQITCIIMLQMMCETKLKLRDSVISNAGKSRKCPAGVIHCIPTICWVTLLEHSVSL